MTKQDLAMLDPSDSELDFDPAWLPSKPFMDTLPIGIYGCDAEGKITFFNKEMARIWGREPDPEQDRYCATYRRFLIDGTELTREETPMAHVLKAGKAMIGLEGVTERMDGERIVCKLNVTPIKDARGATTGAVGVALDISEKRRLTSRLEQEQKKSAEALRFLVEALPVMAWAINRGGELEFVNHRAREFAGEITEQKNPHAWIQGLYHPDDLPRILEDRAKGLSSEKGTFQGTYRMRNKDGSYHWHWVRSVTVEGGGHLHRIGTATDIHDLILAQDNIEKLKDNAEAANHAKSAFLTNMSHEMRTPLTAIIGFADLLGAENLSPEKRSDYIKRISRSGQQLLALIEDILDLSKLEAGQISLHPKAVSPIEIVSEVISILQVDIDPKPVSLDVLAESDVPEEFTTDPVRLRQILLNLCSNAFKFTHEGMVTIVLKTERDETGPLMVFEVRDTGVGISQEERARLFRPFMQGDSSRSKRYGGTGVGLFLSRRLAEALGGHLDLVSSAPGHGSIFRLTLGMNLELSGGLQTKAIRKNAPMPPIHIENIRVLLAEDNPDTQMVLSHFLFDAGAEVEVVANGQLAVERAQNGSFDIILMDVQMPVMDGHEAVRRLRATGYKKPILAVSAYAMAEEQHLSREAGFDAHIVKPISASTLLHAIHKHTHQSSVSE